MEDKQVEELNRPEEKKEDDNSDKKSSPKVLKLVAIMVAFLAIVSVIMTFVTRKDVQKDSYSFRIEKIAELTTLKCYYHNVAVCDVKEKGWFSWNDEKAWIEYEGVVEYGINVNKLVIEDPTKDNVVKVHLPEIEVLKVTLNKESIQKPIIEKGFLAEITTEEQLKIIAETQIEMEANAETDKTRLQEAQDHAKRVIEQYIKTAGNLMGKEYTIEWVTESILTVPEV